MSVGMVLLASGIGKRMRQAIPKQFILLGGKPIVMHTLEKIEQIDEISKVVITCPKNYKADMEQLVRNHGLKKNIICVEGGETRQESVNIGLQNVSEFESVIIHEAVRPFVTVDEYRQLINTEHENAFYGIDIPFTVLKGHDNIEGILEREELVNVQLPQKFNTGRLMWAHQMAKQDGTSFTEDATLYYYYTKEKVKILPGSVYNIKITNPIDLSVGEIIYRDRILAKGE